MATWLKQSTAATVKLGPFVDAADGVTAETALTISQADIRLSKNGGNIAQTNDATGATHDELGYYDVPLDATDTATLGTLRVAVSESGALPVWQDFMVVPANVWDSLFGADALQVDVTQIAGSAVSTTTAQLGVSVVSHVAAAKAEINAEVLDVLNTDTFAEPGQEAPGTTVSLAKKIGYIYKAWRNKVTQTSSTYSLYSDDASTVDQEASVTDDGTTFTRGEVGTGA